MKEKKVYIVIPTFNERQSISALISEIILVLKQKKINGKILVIDDNSPDGTGKIAGELKNLTPNLVEVYHRKEKSGLGPALKFGYVKALQEEAGFLIQLDADLSHNPRSIPRLLKTCENCDMVLGSRYIKGGRVKNWSLMRRSISRFGTLFAKILLKLPFKDLTTGYRCIRVKSLRKIDLKNIRTDGYGFQIEIAYSFHKRGQKIKEIPIEFIERRSGKSKFTKKIAFEAFWKVIELRKNDAPYQKYLGQKKNKH